MKKSESIKPSPHPSGEKAPKFSSLPQHVAVVMDGNGRWAQERGLPRTKGHEAGEAALFDADFLNGGKHKLGIGGKQTQCLLCWSSTGRWSTLCADAATTGK